jgi:hypothetical protein
MRPGVHPSTRRPLELRFDSASYSQVRRGGEGLTLQQGREKYAILKCPIHGSLFILHPFLIRERSTSNAAQKSLAGTAGASGYVIFIRLPLAENSRVIIGSRTGVSEKGRSRDSQVVSIQAYRVRPGQQVLWWYEYLRRKPRTDPLVAAPSASFVLKASGPGRVRRRRGSRPNLEGEAAWAGGLKIALY